MTLGLTLRNARIVWSVEVGGFTDRGAIETGERGAAMRSVWREGGHPA